MKDWIPVLGDTEKPRYVEIAEAIRADVARGVLAPGDRLPPQRAIAQQLGVDFSTVSRGYAEAVRRGYIESFVGRGSFVRTADAPAERLDPKRAAEEDPMMNMPPEPDDPELVARMQGGLAHVVANLLPVLRYQSVTGSVADREIAAAWMSANGIATEAAGLAVTPGAHAAIHAILSVLGDPGVAVLCEDVTYPGLRAIAARLGLRLIGVECDDEGVLPDALEAAITSHWPIALYLNPTLQNPTTRTVPEARREAIAGVLRRHELPLIEDDAYVFVASDAPGPISDRVPGLGWHVAGVSKCFGAGLRLAYVRVPKPELMGAFSQSLRAMHVMASPMSLALMGRWIEEGTAEAVQECVRAAARERQALALKVLDGCDVTGAPEAFNLWLALPEGTSRAEIMVRMAGRQIGIMPSDAFTVAGRPQEAVRVCLGGPIGMEQLADDLGALRDSVMRKDWLG